MADEKSRYVKVVKITYSDIEKDKVDNIINGTVNIIRENGGKVISYLQEIIGVGFSTVYLLYTIIYERSEEIPCEVFKEENKGGNGDNDKSDIK